jgi:L-threonylcarbamoyladenylate synthase
MPRHAENSDVTTEVLRVDPAAPDATAIARASACLRGGGLVAFPTETVYGLGVHALDVNAVRRLFAVKGRPQHDPLIVHVAVPGDVMALVAWPGGGAANTSARTRVDALARHFWPGPLTLVLTRAACVPPEVTAGLDTVAVRIPSHPVARALLGAAGVPVAAPSANLFSRPSPTEAAHVLQDFEDRIEMLLDGGPTTVGVESTVLDVTADRPVVLRPGAVTLEMLRALLPDVTLRDETTRQGEGETGPLPSPGLLTKHYAPRCPMTLYEGAAATARMMDDALAAIGRGKRVGVLIPQEDGPAFEALPVHTVLLGAEADPAMVARRLYAALRELDASDVDLILARAVGGSTGLGLALRDRLRRAAAGRIVKT